jgi:type II secretory pathway pseudopilin PulG
MLVVIAIIVVLMAILFPVFATVRRKAREARCLSNLNQLAMSLKQYRQDHGRYPAAPYYDSVAGRYLGGFSDLFPDYIDNTELLVCPEDRVPKGPASQVVYSSYNGLAQDPRAGQWALTEVYYNYDGYDYGGVPGSAIASTGVNSPLNSDGAAVEAGYLAALNSEYQTKGLRANRDAPRLSNRSAPGNTILTHCVHHRGTGSAADQREFVIRADGSSESNAKRSTMEQDPDDAGPRIAPWIAQLK